MPDWHKNWTAIEEVQMHHNNFTLFPVRVKYLFIYTLFKQINTMPGTLAAVAGGKTKYN